MKKITSIILALALFMSFSATAYADNSPKTGVGDGGAANIDISANYQAGSASTQIVSVDIAWGAMNFTYTDGAEGQWDPATHTTGAAGTGSWSASNNTITVTNHSNVGVTATFDYTQTINTVTGSFSQNTLNLPTAVGTALADAPKGSSNLTLGGTLTETPSGKVGTVTVTISKTI